MGSQAESPVVISCVFRGFVHPFCIHYEHLNLNLSVFRFYYSISCWSNHLEALELFGANLDQTKLRLSIGRIGSN